MRSRVFRLAALAVTLLGPAIAQIATLEIRVLEGEGAVHAPGSRVARPLTVEVADETGRPVAGAAVSFHLPDEGPGGAFANGLRTEVATTDQQGRVALRGFQANRTPGRFQIRIIAAREQARAGVIASQYIAEPKTGAAATARARPRARWFVVAAAIAGAAAATVLSANHKTATAAPPTAPPAPPSAPPISIGSPSTTVGHP